MPRESSSARDVLSAVGTVSALLLAGVTFYYQFVREERRLTAVVVESACVGEVCGFVVALRNEGNRHEIVARVNAVISATSPPAGNVYGPRILGPTILSPGEARLIDVVPRIDFDDTFFRLQRERSGGGDSTLYLKLHFRTIDSRGVPVDREQQVGTLVVRGRAVIGGGGSAGYAPINLLEQQPLTR